MFRKKCTIWGCAGLIFVWFCSQFSNSQWLPGSPQYFVPTGAILCRSCSWVRMCYEPRSFPGWLLQTHCRASLLLFCELPYRGFHSYLSPAGVKEGCLFCLKEVSHNSQISTQISSPFCCYPAYFKEGATHSAHYGKQQLALEISLPLRQHLEQ